MSEMRKLHTVEIKRMDVNSFKHAQKIPLIIILDDIRSLHNVGSVFRTADAFKVKCIYLCGITATPPHPEIHKTALGAELSVDWIYVKDVMQAVAEVRNQGYQILSVEQARGSIALQDMPVISGEKYAIVMGNEVHGVHQKVIDHSDRCVEIPQFGTKHSLNVSVAAGIVIWQLAQKMLL